MTAEDLPVQRPEPEHFCETPFRRGLWRCDECGRSWWIDSDPTGTNWQAEPIRRDLVSND